MPSTLPLFILHGFQFFPDVAQAQQLLLHLLHVQQLCVVAVELREDVALGVAVLEIFVVVQVPLVAGDAVEIAQIDSVGTFLVGQQRLVHLFAVADADDLDLFRVDSACYDIKIAKEGTALSGSEKVNKENLPEVITAVKKENKAIVAPKRMRVTYTLTVDTNAVPAGKLVRCWLPYPRTDQARQRDVKFISASEPEYVFSPQECRHSTLYMEKRAVQGEPTVFSETFEYTSCGEWHNLCAEDVLPYDTTAALYKEYTAEREKHIVFSPRLRELAAKLTAGETNPYLKAKRIFRWINDHFPWASAREYSTIENIPEYVLDNRHGDCGQVSLLFITLCRISGIPAHFQSGFMMHPRAWNLHDWAEVYFEGVGWVPVDQSFGIPAFARNADEEYFFLGGIDSWRMIVNTDYGMPLVPEKKYPRSETVDFQRGEVEWEGGNLYFPQWSYHMDIDYLNY